MRCLPFIGQANSHRTRTGLIAVAIVLMSQVAAATHGWQNSRVEVIGADVTIKRDVWTVILKD